MYTPRLARRMANQALHPTLHRVMERSMARHLAVPLAPAEGEEKRLVMIRPVGRKTLQLKRG
jgi:hypothetical protein